MQSNDVDIQNLLVIMANLPEFLRSSVSREKLKELVEMKDDEKVTVTLRAIKCMQNIPQEHSKKLLLSWFTAMIELDSINFINIAYLYLNIGARYHIHTQTYIDILRDFFRALKDEEKRRVIDKLREVICLFPFRERILTILPNEIQRMISS